MKTYMVVFEKSADGWGAYAPDVPGCGTTGATVDEALANIKEALELWVEATQEQGGVIPEAAHQFAAYVDVETSAALTHSAQT
jgi:predicted RNase H-like HicB family nuclease